MLTALLSPLLALQAVQTRRRMPVLPEALGPREGVLGRGAPEWRILIVGDSSAAGVGVSHQHQAFAGHFTRALHRRGARRVRWWLRARSGLTTAQVHDWLQAEPAPAADVVLVLTGVNDLIDRIRVRRALNHRRALAEWLLAEGRAGAVVFAPLPPVEQFAILPQPLRHVMGVQARRHNAAIARWADPQRGVYFTPLPMQLSAAGMATDGFHPGEPVYRSVGQALALFVATDVLTSQTLP